MSAWCWGMSAETAYSAVSTAVEAMITRGFTRKSTHVGLAMVTPINNNNNNKIIRMMHVCIHIYKNEEMNFKNDVIIFYFVWLNEQKINII